MQASHSMPFGAQPRPQGGVEFRLWAPAAARVALVLGDAEPHRVLDATQQPEGWWHCAVDDAGAGTAYRWRIGDRQLVPDPASRSNPDGVHGASRVVDARSFAWDDGGWQGRPWNEVVLYELHVGSFTPEGSFRAAAARLAELAALGVTAVELLPVAAFGGRFGWGYDGVLPFAPHAAYGSPDELRGFVQQAHRLGLMVFMDVVYNHFGPDGNYLSAYAPGFFSATHESPWGAAINVDGPDSHWVRQFFVHNALYWVEEFRIDGLRLDAVHAIVDDGSPHIVEEIANAVRAATPGRHVHLTLENEHNAHRWLAPSPLPGRYDAQWNDDFHHVLHVALTGEHSGYYGDYADDAEPPLELLARAFTHGMVFEGAPRQGGRRTQRVAVPPQPLGTMVNFAHNHDQVGNRAFGERLSQLAPADAAPLPTLLALLTPATPMLFFGEEFGAATPFLYFADWEGELCEAVRAGRQREFGHAAEDGRPLPDACSIETFRASQLDWTLRGSPAGRAHWDLVQRALAARRQWIRPRQHALLTGQHTARRVGETGLTVQWRYDDGLVLAMDVNLGAAPLAVDGPGPGPVEAQAVFAHRWPAGTPLGLWPAWAARWQIGPEITQ